MGFLFFLLVVGAIIYGSIKTNQAARDKWKTAAESLNLSYSEGNLGSVGSLSGSIHGHQVRVTTFTRGSGKSSQTYTRYTVTYRDELPFNFTISRQKTMHSVGKVFGMQDVEVGDVEFDGEALVQGADPEKIKQFLTPAMREDIRHLLARYPDAVITYDGIQVEKRGRDTEPSSITQCVRNLLSFCNEITASDFENRAPSIPVLEPAAAEPVVMMPTYIIPEPKEDPFQPEPEERPADPIEIVQELTDELPTPVPEQVDPEEPVEATEEEAAVAVFPEPADVDPEGPLDIKGVAESLFGRESGGSLKLAKIFDEQFKGRTIEGSGILTRVEKFNYDMVFKNCTGVKATIEICTIEDHYSKLKIAAVVKFPSEEYENLKDRVDKSLQISGKLMSLDTLMHQIYIDEA